jgi:hypothetical protein
MTGPGSVSSVAQNITWHAPAPLPGPSGAAGLHQMNFSANWICLESIDVEVSLPADAMLSDPPRCRLGTLGNSVSATS